MPISNSTVRKRRRGEFAIHNVETRAAKYAARAIAEASAAVELESPTVATEEEAANGGEVAAAAAAGQLTQMLEESMTEADGGAEEMHGANEEVAQNAITAEATADVHMEEDIDDGDKEDEDMPCA